MTEVPKGKEISPEMEKARAMSMVVARTAKNIRFALLEHDTEGTKKSVAFERAMSKLPMELKGLRLEMTGDNWSWKDPKSEREEAIRPGPGASIALVETDKDKNIISCASTAIDVWANDAVFAGENGVFVYRVGRPQKVEAVDSTYLDQPPQVNLFGQKFTDYWVTMGSVIAKMNGHFRTMNDMGLYYTLRWFDNFKDGKIMPTNAVQIEPNTKFKNEVPAFTAYRLKKTTKSNDVQIRNMRGEEVYESGNKTSAGEYGSVGYVIATTKNAHDKVMSVFRNAVLSNENFSLPSPDPRFARLRAELLSWSKR